MNVVRIQIIKLYEWYSQDIRKIIFILGLHVAVSYIVNLPYINIFASLFSFLPYLIDWIAIRILFHPPKETILKVGIAFFIVGFLVSLIRINSLLEIVGDISFFAIGTYVVLSLKEIKK